MLDEVYDSIDDNLTNYKTLIIKKAHKDITILNKNIFDESNYSIHKIHFLQEENDEASGNCDDC